MAENKTKPTDARVEDYILSRASEQQRTDCHELMALLELTLVREELHEMNGIRRFSTSRRGS
jgi:hypothetical protein